VGAQDEIENQFQYPLGYDARNIAVKGREVVTGA
jgi:hypothetical protein